MSWWEIVSDLIHNQKKAIITCLPNTPYKAKLEERMFKANTQTPNDINNANIQTPQLHAQCHQQQKTIALQFIKQS